MGVTGHQSLPDAAITFITNGIRDVLADFDSIVGYSSLAEGSDQIFATEVLAAGGGLHVVIPCAGYAATLNEEAAVQYRRLLAAASGETRLQFAIPGEAAYDAAGRVIAELCEVLIAVWDGQPARGLGGTADAVKHARELERDVRIIWPPGLTRD